MNPTKLEHLIAAGIRVPDLAAVDLTSLTPDTSYGSVLAYIAGEGLAANVLYLDTEEFGDGAYAELVRQVAALSDPPLPVENEGDDLSEDEAAFWFEVEGVPHRCELEVDDDWLDSKALVYLANVIQARSPHLELRFHGFEGQDMLLMCAERAEFARVNELQGLHFRRFEEPSQTG